MECSLLPNFPVLSQETPMLGLSTSLLNIAGNSVAEITFEDSGAVIRPRASFGSIIGASNSIKMKDSMDFSDFLCLIFSRNCENSAVIRHSVASQLLQSLISSRSLNTLQSLPQASSRPSESGGSCCVLEFDNKENVTCNSLMKCHTQKHDSQATSKTRCFPSNPTTPGVDFEEDDAGTDCPTESNDANTKISGNCPNAGDCSSAPKEANANSADNCSNLDATDASLDEHAVEEETIDSLETGESDEDELHFGGDQKHVDEPAAHNASSNEDEVRLSRTSHTGTRVAEPADRATNDESAELSSKNIRAEDRRYSKVFMPPPLRPPPSAPSLVSRTSSSAGVKVANMKCPLHLRPPPPTGGGRVAPAAASELCAGGTLLSEDKEKSTQNKVQQWNKMFAHVDFAKVMLPPASKSNESAAASKRKPTVAHGPSLSSQLPIGPEQMLALQRPSIPKTRRLPSKRTLPSFSQLSSARPLPSPPLAMPRNTMQLPPCSTPGSARRDQDMVQEDLSSVSTRLSSGNSLRFKESGSCSKSKLYKSQNRPSGLYTRSVSFLSAKNAEAPAKLPVWDIESFPQAEQPTSLDHKMLQSILKQFAEARINAQRTVRRSLQEENMELDRVIKLSSPAEISQHLGSLTEHSVKLCGLIENSKMKFSELDDSFKNPEEDENVKKARSSISAEERDHAHRPSHSDVRFQVWKLNRLHKDSVRILRAFPPRGVFTISKILKKNDVKAEETAFEVWKQKFQSCSIQTGSSKVLVLKFLHNGSIKKHHYRFESNDEVQQFFLYVKHYMET